MFIFIRNMTQFYIALLSSLLWKSAYSIRPKQSKYIQQLSIRMLRAGLLANKQNEQVVYLTSKSFIEVNSKLN